MVKVQKPIPKKLGNKPKLDNPIKKKKEQIKKEKSTSTVKNLKAKLIESPVNQAKAANKTGKDVGQKKQDVKKQKKTQNGMAKVGEKPPSPVVSKTLKEQSLAEVKGNVVKKGKKKLEKSLVATLAKVSVAAKIATPMKGPVIKVTASSEAPASAKIATQSIVKGKSAVPVKNSLPVQGTIPGKVTSTVKATAAVKTVAPIKAAAPIKASAPVKVAAAIKTAAPIKATAPVKVAVPAKGPAAHQKAAKVPAVKIPIASQKPVAAAASQPTKGPVAPPKPQKGKKKKNQKAAPVATDVPPSAKKPEVHKKLIQLQEKKKAKIAFKRAKQSAGADTGKKNDKKEKKEKREVDSIRYDPIPYDEEKFTAIVNEDNIKKIAEALKTQVEKEVATKKSSIFDDYRYFLQVGSFKIPNCPKRMVKLSLKHSLIDKDDDVLLVVPDLQRGSKVDYEPTIHHYEDLFRSQDIEGIKIMPMNQLRKEFGTFEQKRRLCASYEHFLCDGRIVSHVVGIVGKLTQKPRHTFHAVRMNENKNIKNEIAKALRKTAFRQLSKSSLQAIPVGTHKFTSQQLAENVQHVVEQLKKVFPGGLGNIRNLHLKIDITGTSALPLYISMAQAPEKTPMVVGPREQRMIKLKREANEVLSKFAMTKEGRLIKLSQPEAEKKRKLQEMKAALKEDEEVLKKAKKAKKATTADAEKKKDEVKELELPENEEDDDDSSDDDDDNLIQLGSNSEDDEEDGEGMDEFEQVEDDEDSLDAEESETEIVENGLVEEAEEEDQQEIDGSDDDDEDEDVDEEDIEDDDDEEDEDSD